MEVPDYFFDKLVNVMGHLHERGIAYTDTNKRDNIIVGEDGHPYLIDFQISFGPTVRSTNGLLAWALRFMQRMDLYHIYKHKSRLRPDLMKLDEWKLRRNAGVLLKAHRCIFKPFRDFRRTTLARLR